MPVSPFFLGVLLAASVAVNAALFQQLLASREQLHTSLSRLAHLEESERNLELTLEELQKQRLSDMEDAERLLAASQRSEGMMDFSRIPIRTIQQMGHLFFANKLSETLMDEDVMKILGYNEEMLGRQQYLTNHGYEMLSVRVNPSERASEQLQEDTVESMVDRLNEAGMVLIPSLHDPTRCRRLAHEVHHDIMNPQSEFGNIMKLQFRKDLPLILSGDYLEILRDSLLLFQPVIERTLGKSAILKEFSTLTSYPGAEDQHFHQDSHPTKTEDLVDEAKLFSAFIYLDDVGENSAPFDAIPGTHTHYHFVKRDSTAREIMRNNPYVRLAVPQGSMVIYNSRLRHRGSGNESPLTRPTFYFSLMESNKPPPRGPTYSLHRTYRNHSITVEDIIARNIPPANIQELMADHDDELCEKSMHASCAGAPSPERLYDCAVNPRHKARHPRLPDIFPSDSDDSDDAPLDLDFRSRRYMNLPLANCTLRSRMERIAGANIFQPGFVAKVSWGDL